MFRPFSAIDFEQVTSERPGGGRYLTEFVECYGCSLTFRNAEKIARCERFGRGRG